MWGFPAGSDGQESAGNAGDPDLILGLGRLLEKGMATHSSVFKGDIISIPHRLSENWRGGYFPIHSLNPVSDWYPNQKKTVQENTKPQTK